MYDNNGDTFGFTYNGTDYYYIKNVQNDVIAIADGAGAIVCRYYYDAWGKILSIKDGNGNTITNADTLHIGNINPIRYRSYYYDTESKLYYLNSRYYSPEMCRFLNSDSVVSGVGQDIMGYNMFVYCHNNPVNMSDENGNWPKWVTKIVDTVNAIAYSIVYEFGIGAGLKGTANVGLGSVSAGHKADIANWTYSKGELKRGYKETYGVNVSVGPYSFNGEQGVYHPNDKKSKHDNCPTPDPFTTYALEKYKQCPSAEIIGDIPEFSFEIGIEVYVIFGVTVNIGIDTDYLIEELIKIYSEE